MGTIAVVVEWHGGEDLHGLLSGLMPSGKAAPQMISAGQVALAATDGTALLQEGPLLLACNARIDNGNELRQLLGITPDTLLPPEDGALILAAYRKWGANCPAQLIGDFAFVLWDCMQRRLLAARDGMNMRTLSYVRTPNGFCLASEIKPLLQHPVVSGRFNPLSLAGWVSGWPDPDLSMFEGVEVLPAGHALVASVGNCEIRRFWDIDPGRRIRYRDTREYQEHLRDLLKCAVADRLRGGDTVVASQMSGGMDSTTVTALARGELAKHNRELLVLSHSYHSVANCDETDRIRETLAHLSIDNVRFLAAEQHADRDFRELYPPAADSPGTVLSPRYRDEMALLRDAGIRVLLTGCGGDEMTWGHSLTYAQRLRRGDLAAVRETILGCRELQLPLLRTLRQLFLDPFVPAWLKRAMGRSSRPSRLPDWVPRDTIRRFDLEERLLDGSETRFRNPALQARYEALRRTSTLNSVRSYGRVGADYGIEVRHPFFDTRLAEFSFAIPDDLWIREGYPKWLLRRTMDGILPDSVCWNRHKVTFDDFFGKLIRDQAEGIRTILADRQLEEMGLLDTARLLETFDRVVAQKQPFNVDLLYVLMTQVWVQKFRQSGTAGVR